MTRIALTIMLLVTLGSALPACGDDDGDGHSGSNAGATAATSGGSGDGHGGGSGTDGDSCAETCSSDDSCFPPNASCICGTRTVEFDNCIDGCCSELSLMDKCEIACGM